MAYNSVPVKSLRARKEPACAEHLKVLHLALVLSPSSCQAGFQCTCKDLTQAEMAARVKHNSLLRQNVSYATKKFCKTARWRETGELISDSSLNINCGLTICVEITVQ
jgi:hypothetical protein